MALRGAGTAIVSIAQSLDWTEALRKAVMGPSQEETGGAVAAAAAAIYLAYFGLILALLVSQLAVAVMYFGRCVAPTMNKWIPPTADVPADMKTGALKYGLFDCTQECKTCMFMWLCGPCGIADTWYRMGWSYSIFPGSDPCSTYYKGLALLIFSGCVPCGEPCMFGALRGGVGGLVEGPDGKVFGARPMRMLFNMPKGGIATFLEDCLTWAFCLPCAATQEWRQASAALERMPEVDMAQVFAMPRQVEMMGPAGAMGQPMAGPMFIQQPGMGQPGAPVMGQPVMGQPMAGPMFIQQPGMGQPGAPVMGQPVMGQIAPPASNAPAFNAPM